MKNEQKTEAPAQPEKLDYQKVIDDVAKGAQKMMLVVPAPEESSGGYRDGDSSEQSGMSRVVPAIAALQLAWSIWNDVWEKNNPQNQSQNNLLQNMLGVGPGAKVIMTKVPVQDSGNEKSKIEALLENMFGTSTEVPDGPGGDDVGVTTTAMLKFLQSPPTKHMVISSPEVPGVITLAAPEYDLRPGRKDLYVATEAVCATGEIFNKLKNGGVVTQAIATLSGSGIKVKLLGLKLAQIGQSSFKSVHEQGSALDVRLTFEGVEDLSHLDKS